ncbi:DUF4253 domain-containing protein [Streptomyces sp. NPDC008150]|uniref:DUF4253 domain-containing protein n=1 Tax=Streptomyces sp. NPDC008150 TaxID=3364816 RepID=UPI0036ED3148
MATLPNPLPRLADDPSGSSLGLRLPAGRLIDTTDHGRWHEPLLWCAGEPPAPGEWSALAPARRVGLLPVLVDGATDIGPDWYLRPGDVSYPGDHDAEEVLAHSWDDHMADALHSDENHAGIDAADTDVTDIDVTDTAPGSPAALGGIVSLLGADWPGTAPAGTLRRDPDECAADVVGLLLREGTRVKEGRLALVPARRSADLPAAIGWTGAAPFEDDTARLCAVLRSWEDRFGIRVVALRADELVVSVAAPPTTAAHAEAVAAEHFAFCPDAVLRGNHDTLRDYAHQEVLDEEVWAFWWD